MPLEITDLNPEVLVQRYLDSLPKEDWRDKVNRESGYAWHVVSFIPDSSDSFMTRFICNTAATMEAEVERHRSWLHKMPDSLTEGIIVRSYAFPTQGVGSNPTRYNVTDRDREHCYL